MDVTYRSMRPLARRGSVNMISAVQSLLRRNRMRTTFGRMRMRASRTNALRRRADVGYRRLFVRRPRFRR